MKSTLACSAVAVLLAAGAAPAHAQEATERFIPIGQSPGLSGKLTHIGAIRAFDTAARTLTVDAAGGPMKVRITDGTAIWIDRSRQKETSAIGTSSDLQTGRRVEVKWKATEQGAADWIKIEAMQ